MPAQLTIPAWGSFLPGLGDPPHLLFHKILHLGLISEPPRHLAVLPTLNADVATPPQLPPLPFRIPFCPHMLMRWYHFLPLFRQ